MKQTAVEWLVEKMYKECINVFTDEEIEQAKEMEKEQIMYAHIEGFFSEPFKSRKGQAEQYYNETFKKD